MSVPLFKLIAVQRLLDEMRELLEGETLSAFLRLDANDRADRLRFSSRNGRHETCQTSCLKRLVKENRKFGTIYADPPWHYTNAASRGAAENHYETMTTDAIADLPVAQLAADEAHLHLWTTNAFLFEAERVIKAWGSRTRVASFGSSPRSATATIGASATNFCFWVFAAT